METLCKARCFGRVSPVHFHTYFHCGCFGFNTFPPILTAPFPFLSKAMLRPRSLLSRRQVPCLTRSYASPASNLPPALHQKTDPTLVPPYEKLISQLSTVRQILDRPLTLAEKILYAHLHDVEEGLAGSDRKIRGNKVKHSICILELLFRPHLARLNSI